MQYITREIGSQTIVFDRPENKIFVTFEIADGWPPETYQLTFDTAEDALTGYWICCNTATTLMNESILA